MTMEKWLVPLVCLFAAKVVIVGFHLSETLALAVFAAFVLVKEHYDTHKEVRHYKEELELLKKEVETVKTSVAGVKLAAGMRGINGKP